MEFDFDGVRRLLPPCSRGDNAVFDRCLQTAPSSRWCRSPLRRFVDISMAIGGLILFAVPMLLIACLIRLTSGGPALIRQQRVGRGGRFFDLLKFRSMAEGEQAGSGLTIEGDSRLTPIGVLLRRFKLDELPQLYNVLRGDMSIVGPRPKLPQFAEIPDMPYLPGITGLASLAFRAEGRILRCVAPERVESFYQQRIKPLKANLDVCYMCCASPASDVRMIAATAVSCLAPGMVARLVGLSPQEPGFRPVPIGGREPFNPE